VGFDAGGNGAANILGGMHAERAWGLTFRISPVSLQSAVSQLAEINLWMLPASWGEGS
jgi:hypothetical protein